MSFLSDIIQYVRHEPCVYIQTHSYPDHDAIASAFGLQELLAQCGVAAHIVYEGEIQRESLHRMISELRIEVRKASTVALEEGNKIIIVDGCKGNKNVAELVGEEIAVIDHHAVGVTEDVPFVDIRPDYGSCSSIIYSYYREMDKVVPRNVATALMIGINMDTSLLTRGVNQWDVEAYANLYHIADVRLQNTILRNFIQTKDLSFYRFALEHVEITDGTAYCFFSDGCDQNLLGILGDFFLALREVHFVVLCARNNTAVNFSLRNERDDCDASRLLQDVLRGIGFGGGHRHMAGGVIPDVARFNEPALREKFLDALRRPQAHEPPPV